MEYRVSEKGALSIYWLNYRPFTLYADEWAAVFKAHRMILRFIATHHPQLACRCGEETRQAFQDALARGDFGSETRIGSLSCGKALTGAVSLYGLRRFPVTLYCLQWLRVLQARPRIEEFMRENADKLVTKGCCVPRPSSFPPTRPQREAVGADNIIRPVTARL